MPREAADQDGKLGKPCLERRGSSHRIGLSSNNPLRPKLVAGSAAAPLDKDMVDADGLEAARAGKGLHGRALGYMARMYIHGDGMSIWLQGQANVLLDSWPNSVTCLGKRKMEEKWCIRDSNPRPRRV